ncbi:non-ribosomal peptide synthetase subunit [Rothia sp. (in: high G+C Gram-positive bacteria)]|uniref:non-ribosomal peptide synthetase subunit n=1 Tax=Rothia sp. (in: high G+C Gram-positive bacteria) TaxID=1885016 RepID=UPI0025F30963|nr:non-ribosomal peptide synthetase subunit [Rothia sp. (in: high G+C Gram-positive bacteria)]
MSTSCAAFALLATLPSLSVAGPAPLYTLLGGVLAITLVVLLVSLRAQKRRGKNDAQQNQRVSPPYSPYPTSAPQAPPHAPGQPQHAYPSQVQPPQAQNQQGQPVRGAVSYPQQYLPNPQPSGAPQGTVPANDAQQNRVESTAAKQGVPSPLAPLQVENPAGAQDAGVREESRSEEAVRQEATPPNGTAQQEETTQKDEADQPKPAPSDHFSLSTNFKLIPPLEYAQRSRYPMVLSVSKSEDEVFALPSISGVPQHLLVGTQENHVPLNQRQRWEQVSILENYLMRAVMNLQTLERAQVSPLHSFKETAQADRTVLAAELEETIRVSRLKLSGALEFYTSLPRLAEAPGSFAFARDHALSLSATVISLTEECFERTFRWRLLEDTLPDSLSDRLYAVRYLRESAQKLAAFVELSEFDRAMQLAETWKKTARKDSKIDEGKVWNEMTEVAFDVLPELRERALKGVQSTLEFSELFYRTGEDGVHRMLRPEQLSEFELKGVQSTLEERLEKVRLELQDAEFCAAVLSLQTNAVIEFLEELLQIERDGVLTEIVTDLRALAHDSPDLAEQPIQTLMFSREQYAPDGEDLPTIGERIRSLSSVPEVLAFVHYEGPVLLVGVSDPYKAFSGEGSFEGLLSEEMKPSSMPLSVLRTHSRLLQQVLRLQNLRLKLAWVSSCSGYMPLSLVERYYVGPSAADEDLKELTENIEALAELLEARASSREYRGRDVPVPRILWSQMRKQADCSSRLLNTVQFLGWMFASSSRVKVVNGIAQSIHDVDAAEVVEHLMSNLKIARRR